MLSPKENPPILSPWVRSVGELQQRWWVAHTRPRAEKALARDLLQKRIGYFLPLIRRVRYCGGKKRHVMLPLFTSYVFICGTDEDRYAALTTNRLCGMLDVDNQRRLLQELQAIEKALFGEAELDPYPFAAVGEICRVHSGPFAGLVGTVIERSRTSRLVLQVDILGQGAVIEIDTDLLESAC